jgi:FMN phosphatase YigB (HAD superfamily)
VLGGLILDFGGVLTDPDGADRLLAVVADLRHNGIRTGILSNADHVDPGISELFDVTILGGRKPDVRIYLAAANRLGLTPEQCVFVDDTPAFVHGAVRAGMVGVHHDDVDTTITELAALFETPQPN